MKTIEILNRGSLLTYHDGGHERCFGYLMHFAEHGTYEANLGRVDVSTDEANAHNQLLDVALIEGLDENCQVGQSGVFYLGKKDGRPGRPDLHRHARVRRRDRARHLDHLPSQGQGIPWSQTKALRPAWFSTCRMKSRHKYQAVTR